MIATPNYTQDVYDRLSYKARNEINDLDGEEREKAEDLLIDEYVEQIRRKTDEELLQGLMDLGLVL